MSRPLGMRSLAALAIAGACAVGAFLLLRDGAPLNKVADKARLIGRHTALGWQVRAAPLAGDGQAGFADGPVASARFADPFGLVVDRAGTVFVADAGDNNRIRAVHADGSVTTVAGKDEGFADGAGAAAAFNTPSGLAIDEAGNLYVADTGNHAIRKVTPQGIVSTLAGTGAAGYRDGAGAQALFNAPVGIAVDKAGKVYVADTYNDRIRVIAPGGEVSTLAGNGLPGEGDGPAAGAGFDTPCALALGADGALYIADTGNGSIRKLGADGMVTTYARSPAGTRELMRRPVALAITHDGFLYVGDLSRGRILQVAPGGALHGLTGVDIDFAPGDNKAARFKRPAGLAVERNGALLVADALTRRISRLAPPDGKAQTVAAPSPVPPAPGAAREPLPWPLAPRYGAHEVVGVVGEVRGNYSGESRDHFHNGLDVQGAMGAPVLAVLDEKVSSPWATGGFGELGEGLSLDSLSYIHMRVGRDIKDAPINAARFTLLADDKGKPARVRVRRGTRFHSGDTLGTLNRMFHVHLAYNQNGDLVNAQQLPFKGMSDSVAPHISGITLFDQAGAPLSKKRGKRLLVAAAGGPLSIVLEAHDQNEGNAARRRLGLYKAGYQILRADGTPLPGFEQPLVNIEFNRLPPDQESVTVAYAPDSGITVHGSAVTRFLYVLTNTVRDGKAST
ncbi:MAG: NHL repeat-containing protein, partial [Massilia sp.]